MTHPSIEELLPPTDLKPKSFQNSTSPLPKKKQLASTQWLKLTALNLTLEQLNVMFILRVKM